MSLLSYQLLVKRYQRELGLSDRTFNALDYKYNDVNLLKQLQILNPVAASAPAPTNTGWYGVLQIGNTENTGLNMIIKVETIDGAVVNEIIPNTIITSENQETDYIYYNLAIGNRLKSPSTIIKIYYTQTTGPSGTGTDKEGSIDGLFIESNTFNGTSGYTEYSVLSGYINDGFLQISFILS